MISKTAKFSIVLANSPDEIPSDLFLRNPNLGNQFPRLNCDQSVDEINRRLKKDRSTIFSQDVDG